MSRKHFSRTGLTRRDVLKYGLYGGISAAMPGCLFLNGCGTQKQHGKKPNIILITVDTLRADHLGCYGYAKDTSPNIDKFAQDSILFENCFSHGPDTGTSFSSIFSGFLPHETKITECLYLPSKVDTIAEILQPQGYNTLAVVSNYVLRKSVGFEQGFMLYDDTMDEYELVRKAPERTAGRTTDRAIELLNQYHKTQLFMWIHYQDPHGPYTPPEPFNKIFHDSGQKPRMLKVNRSMSGYGGIPSYQRLGQNKDFHYYVSQYNGEIRYHDSHFKRLINEIKTLGLYDDSLIIFSSDHGEGMGEHGYFFGHSENLYNSQIHVPLIIKYGSSLNGRRNDFVKHIDIVPTILNITGVKSSALLRGRDLCVQHENDSEIFSESQFGHDFSIVCNGFKLIYTPSKIRYELFDLNADFNEENNLVNDKKYHKHVENLKLRLHRLKKEDLLDIDLAERQKKLTGEEIEKLKSLGYVR